LKNLTGFTEFAEKMWSVATEQNLPMWAGWGRAMRGYCRFENGDRDGGIAEIQAGLAAFRATGAEMNTAYLISCLVEAYLTAGEIELGLEKVNDALALKVDCDSYYRAELLRLKGELLRKLPSSSPADAAACFRQALSTAQAQSAKSLELRAATSMGRLLFSQGERTSAIRLVSDVYDWFTEGLDTADLVGAKRLIDTWQAA
jgi:predicted ATPase